MMMDIRREGSAAYLIENRDYNNHASRLCQRYQHHTFNLT